MADLIGEALVKIRPDLTGLRFQVQAGLAEALSGLSATALGGAAGATGAAAAATASLSAETLGLAGAAVGAADAEGTLAVALRAAGIAAGTTAAANVELAASTLGISTAATRASGGVTLLGGAAGKAGKGTHDLVNNSNLARGAIIGLARVTPVAIFGLGVAGTAAVALALGFRNAIQSAADFQKQLNVFRVVAQATGTQMRAVSDMAVELGRDVTLPGVAAGDAAASMTELAKAGLSVRDSIDAARGVLQLGTAAQIQFGDAAKIVASALNAFALPGREAVHVADLLAASSIAAQGEITDMAAALQQSSAVAKQANISIEDTVTAISLLAKNGLIGSDAGTSLRTTILRLVPTTKEAAQYVHALGIEFADSQGNLKPLPEIFDQYRIALAKLPPVLQQAALQQIFGQDAIRAATILAREGASGFAAMKDQVEREGVAAEVAGAQTAGFSGHLSALGSNLETFGITVGSFIIDFLDPLIIGLSDTVGWMDALANSLGDLTISFGQFKPPQGLQDAVDSINSINLDPGKVDSFFNALGKALAGIHAPVSGTVGLSPEEARQVGVALRAQRLSAEELRAVFADSTSDIGKMLKDGIISPLEVIQLQSTATGAAFLSGFAKPGSELARTSKAVDELTKALGRVPTTTEVRFVVNSKGINQAVNEAQFQAYRAGTLVGKAANDAAAAAWGNATPITQATDHVLDVSAREARSQADKFSSVGAKITENIASNISATEQQAINAAREAVAAAQKAAEEQTRQAVFSARDNLTQLGQSLTSQIDQLIDVGPIAQKIKRLQGELDAINRQANLARLREDQRTAQSALREAQASIVNIGGALTPEQQRAQEDFLKPFQQRVKDANAALKEFDLSEQIDSLNKAKQAAKDAAEKGIGDLVQKFKDGKVSAAQFQALLQKQLGPELDILKSKAGRNLGLSFTAGFLQNVRDLRDQVKELVAFLGITGPSPNVVRPGQVAQEGAASVAEARKNLKQTIANAKATAENTGDSADTLKDIRRILNNRLPKPKVTTGGSK